MNKVTAKKTAMKKVTVTGNPRYILRPVHIEAGLVKRGRENFQTRLADLVNEMKKRGVVRGVRDFAEKVTASRAEGETTKLTYQDMNNYLYNQITAKANKIGLICHATGLPREYFEDFDRTKTQILKSAKLR